MDGLYAKTQENQAFFAVNVAETPLEFRQMFLIIEYVSEQLRYVFADV